MKNVIITGATGGLGVFVTNEFLASGFRVIATVADTEKESGLVAHPNLEQRAVDLSNEQETTEFVASVIEKYKTIDAALLLVGGFAMGSIGSTSGNDLKRMYKLNFETAYYTTRALFGHMVTNGVGRLVFIGARPAISPASGKSMIAYALSKSLLFSLAQYLNEDAKGTNVVTTVVVPSTLDTPLNRANMPNVDWSDWVSPQQLSDILTFICGDSASVLRETVLKVYGNS